MTDRLSIAGVLQELVEMHLSTGVYVIWLVMNFRVIRVSLHLFEFMTTGCTTQLQMHWLWSALVWINFVDYAEVRLP